MQNNGQNTIDIVDINSVDLIILRSVEFFLKIIISLNQSKSLFVLIRWNSDYRMPSTQNGVAHKKKRKYLRCQHMWKCDIADVTWWVFSPYDKEWLVYNVT